jgi:SP family sugar:H+ symporter-like MFS transporter
MAILDRFKAKASSPASSMADPEKKPQILEIGMRQIFRPRIIAMAIIVSMGGFIFGMIRSAQFICKNVLTTFVGYDTGQISGFLEMPDFLEKFHDVTKPDGSLAFSNSRSGLIVALVRLYAHSKYN